MEGVGIVEGDDQDAVEHQGQEMLPEREKGTTFLPDFQMGSMSLKGPGHVRCKNTAIVAIVIRL